MVREKKKAPHDTYDRIVRVPPCTVCPEEPTDRPTDLSFLLCQLLCEKTSVRTLYVKVGCFPWLNDRFCKRREGYVTGPRGKVVGGDVSRLLTLSLSEMRAFSFASLRFSGPYKS